MRSAIADIHGCRKETFWLEKSFLETDVLRID